MAGRLRLLRFTRGDVEVMVRAGVIPEDASTELLNGLIVFKDRSAVGQDPETVGIDHTKCVELLSDLRGRINSPARHVRSHQPLFCSETHVPEPDLMVLRGTLDDYSDLPTSADAWCVVEVADGSYDVDAGEKLAAYARAGLGQYVIVNLRNRTAEVYAGPDAAAGTYATRRVVGEGEAVGLRMGAEEGVGVELRRVLPSPSWFDFNVAERNLGGAGGPACIRRGCNGVE